MSERRSADSSASVPSTPARPAAGVESPLERESDASDHGEVGPEPIGRYLKRQRELRGMSAQQLADLTRIPIRSINRLEGGSFDHDIDGFVRGFVRTVASSLGLDPDDTMSRMLGEPHGDRDLPPRRSRIRSGVFVATAGLVLVVLAVGLIQAVLQREPGLPRRGEVSDVVWRRDPVRALADAHAVSGFDTAMGGTGADPGR